LSVDDLINLTRETVMTDPIEGQLSSVHLRVGDGPRAAAYFGALFGWTFTEQTSASTRAGQAVLGAHGASAGLTISVRRPLWAQWSQGV
jgi:predicted enzyme related to lactoylglutathione lyase